MRYGKEVADSSIGVDKIMAYQADLGNGQKIYLENRGTRTYITLANSSPGQQQQSNSAIETGTWTKSPQLLKTLSGFTVEVFTDTGPRFIEIQGSNVSIAMSSPVSNSAESLSLRETSNAPTLPPMEPMEPMQMGDMQMSLNPMEMRMGEMEMRMGKATTRFCSQCGATVQQSDRFCANCGHQLQS